MRAREFHTNQSDIMFGDSMYLENVKEYVDDHKIVTYKWLSRKLEVPINAAKQMLYAYVEKNSSVMATYSISGVIAAEGQKHYEVHIVEAGDLEATKQKFEEIFGVHIFSVQNIKLKDSDSFFAASCDTCVNLLKEYSRWSPIDCPSQPCSTPIAIAQDKEPVKPLLTPSLPKVAQIKSENSSPSSIPKKSFFSKKSETKKFPPKGSYYRKPFFVKEEPAVTEKQAASTDNQEISSPASSLEISPAQPPDEKSIHPFTRRIEKERSSHQLLGFLSDSDIDDGESDEPDVSKITAKRQVKNERNIKCSKVRSTEKGGKGAISAAPSKNEGGTKKRKRVQELSSDEGETPGDTNESFKSKRKRTKKLTSKMYVNEEGEMVTEKVWESDSTEASGEEKEVSNTAEQQPSMEEKSVSISSKLSPIKQERKKQASLFKFIKK